MSATLHVMPPAPAVPELDGSLADMLEAKCRAEIADCPGADFLSFLKGFTKGVLSAMRSGDPSRAFEALRRREKAERFANALDAWEFTGKQLLAMSPRQWELTAEGIGEKVPSQLTQSIVCAMILAREKARATVAAAKRRRS